MLHWKSILPDNPAVRNKPFHTEEFRTTQLLAYYKSKLEIDSIVFFSGSCIIKDLRMAKTEL